MKKVTLELGGKSPNIILDDADLDTAALGALFGTFMHQGQICESGTRVLVHEKIHDEFVDKMIAGSKRIQIGDTMDMMTDDGPAGERRAARHRREATSGSGKSEGAKCVARRQAPERA